MDSRRSSRSTTTSDHHRCAAMERDCHSYMRGRERDEKSEENTEHSGTVTPPIGATSILIFNFCNLSHVKRLIARLNLSGCAAIPEGVLVVEGPTSSIERFWRVMGLAREKPDSVILKGRVCMSRFGKLYVLSHCNDFAVPKFFANHRASLYWDHVVRSKSNGPCC